MLTRRDSLILLAGTPVGLSLLAGARPDYPALLQKRLDALVLPFAPSRLALVKYAYTQDSDIHHMRALIHISWPPGQRQQYFDATHQNSDLALTGIVTSLYQHLTAVAGPAGQVTV